MLCPAGRTGCLYSLRPDGQIIPKHVNFIFQLFLNVPFMVAFKNCTKIILCQHYITLSTVFLQTSAVLQTPLSFNY